MSAETRTTPPRPPQARFWDRIAERYAAKPVADPAAYEEKLRITRGYLRADMTVLEIGCGTGSTALAHARHVRQILATDISEKMIAIAQAKARAAGIGNVAFRRAAVAEIDAPPASYDVVLGLSILHLLKDWRAEIGRIHAMLKPGGAFITNTACLGDSMPVLRWVGPLGAALGFLPALSVFTARELETALTDAGFVIERHGQPGQGTSQALFIVARKPD